jgi:hypothetical protein
VSARRRRAFSKVWKIAAQLFQAVERTGASGRESAAAPPLRLVQLVIQGLAAPDRLGTHIAFREPGGNASP